jgi:hypothetical protein
MKGVTLFALVDHRGEAEKMGMKMLPTKLLIFGNACAFTSFGGLSLELAVGRLVTKNSPQPRTEGVAYSPRCRAWTAKIKRLAGEYYAYIGQHSHSY